MENFLHNTNRETVRFTMFPLTQLLHGKGTHPYGALLLERHLSSILLFKVYARKRGTLINPWQFEFMPSHVIFFIGVLVIYGVIM